jgi:hypothetical protein
MHVPAAPRVRWNVLLHRTAASGGFKESSAECILCRSKIGQEEALRPTVALVMVLFGIRSHGRWPSPVPRRNLMSQMEYPRHWTCGRNSTITSGRDGTLPPPYY